MSKSNATPQLDLPTATIICYAEVILPLALPTTYTYAVPENFAEKVQARLQGGSGT